MALLRKRIRTQLEYFRIISLKYGDRIIKLNVTDTAGQERFKSLSSKYYRSAHGFFFVFDVNSLETFKNIKNWIDATREYNERDVINFLIGNKVDKETRQVKQEDAISFAKENNMLYFETSAKEGKNVDESFGFITQKLVRFYSKNVTMYHQMRGSDVGKFHETSKLINKGEDIGVKEEEQKKKKGCCG